MAIRSAFPGSLVVLAENETGMLGRQSLNQILHTQVRLSTSTQSIRSMMEQHLRVGSWVLSTIHGLPLLARNTDYEIMMMMNIEAWAPLKICNRFETGPGDSS